jgi:hypothetical protein
MKPPQILTMLPDPPSSVPSANCVPCWLT